jgi:hypothetical protein
MTRISIFLFLVEVVCLSGCTSIPGRAYDIMKIEANTIFNSNTFGGFDQTSRVQWIGDEKSFEAVKNNFNGPKLGGNEISLPAIDFSREGILFIRMGRKPTTGYRIELASTQVDIKGQTAIVNVHWIEPSKDAILAQMITSPCTMIKMTRGNYNEIRVVDQNGIIRAETRVEHP